MVASVTQKDIARILGVNRSTVTRALNGHPDISEDLRNRILELSQSLGYHKNINAASLTTRKTMVISILHSHSEMYIGEIHALWITQLYKGLSSRGYLLRLDTMKQLTELMASRSADGFIMFGSPEEIVGAEYYPLFTSTLADPESPIVRIDCSVGVTENAVPIDGTQGTADAVEYLLGLGHRKIAYFGNIRSSLICGDRYRGYTTALNNREIAAPSNLTINLDDWTEDLETLRVYKDAIYQWANEGVTAILTPSDTIAIGLMKIIKEIGLSVPDDISVIGFDDGRLAVLPDPPLTSIKQDINTASAQAIDMLMAKLSLKTNIPSRIVNAPLIIRGSTNLPPFRKG